MGASHTELVQLHEHFTLKSSSCQDLLHNLQCIRAGPGTWTWTERKEEISTLSTKQTALTDPVQILLSGEETALRDPMQILLSCKETERRDMMQILLSGQRDCTQGHNNVHGGQHCGNAPHVAGACYHPRFLNGAAHWKAAAGQLGRAQQRYSRHATSGTASKLRGAGFTHDVRSQRLLDDRTGLLLLS